MNFEFSYFSERARKSRFYVNLSHKLKRGLTFFDAILSILGLSLWVISPLLGSITLAVSVMIALPLVWFTYDVERLRPSLPKEGGKIKIEESLPIEAVGRLRSIDTPYDIWLGVRGTWQQRFFCLRYAVPVQVFDTLNKYPGTSAQVLDEALRLSLLHKENRISVASIMVALLKIIPHHEHILAAEGMDVEELESSIDWLHHHQDLIDRLGKVKHFGGLARDWTSGYTPTLNQMSHNISADVEHGGFMHRDLGVHSKTIDQMVNFMSEGRQNVMLVGEVGVGKTISVSGFAQRILTDPSIPESIRYHQVFALNPSNIIALSGDATKVEATILSIIAEAQKAKNTILFFDDASTFFHSGTGQIDLGRVLMPLIENNSIPVIFAMTPTEWQEVTQSNQALAGLMNYMVVTEPTKEETLRVLEDYSITLEARHKEYVTYHALEQSYELADRYINDVAFPGRAVSVLENAVNHAEAGIISAKSVQMAIEATQGVKVQLATGAEKQELLNLEDEIHKRMINQTRAVRVVSDALRRARSGVNNPNRPLGTFLFLGPTGVGKTELSKAVAAVFFGQESNMVRVDMNEFTQSTDVSRLLDVTNTSSLLSQVGRNRFTVVLFDEIEKAHPEVVNVFLQLLDEGVMRDVNNREVSFRDTIVIATSNAGADSIRAYIEAGKQIESFEKDFINSLIDSNLFKPEFLNRFDETVIFRPLKQEELLLVVDLLMAEVNRNLDKQKVTVVLTKAAKNWLAKEGYDPKLGARPLRRMVQRTVENVVAKRILQSSFSPGSTLTLDQVDLEIEAKNR